MSLSQGEVIKFFPNTFFLYNREKRQELLIFRMQNEKNSGIQRKTEKMR